MPSNPIQDRVFSERASLRFVFPDRENSLTRRYSVKLPLYETPIINEEKTPRYGKYSILGRNSNLYTYQGAESRNVSLMFNITLPHLYETIKSLTAYKINYTLVTSINDEKNRFKSNILTPDIERGKEVPGKRAIDSHTRVYNQHFTTNAGLFDGIVPGAIEGITNFVRNFGDFLFGAEGSQPTIDRDKIKAIYYFWINLIRASVVGSEKGDLGPPTVRFSFGALYQDVPFIVTKYSINVDDTAGYDIKTMLPHRVTVTLSLEELRVGDFGKHNPSYKTSDISGDNVAGWESVIEHGSMDPRIGSVLDQE